jgi:hypothetical protein
MIHVYLQWLLELPCVKSVQTESGKTKQIKLNLKLCNTNTKLINRDHTLQWCCDWGIVSTHIITRPATYT